MSDPGRKDMTDKAKETVTPDSTKSTQQKAKEDITDTGDKAARGLQSDDSKSTGQKMADKADRSKDEHKDGGSIVDKTKHALGMDKHKE